MAHSHIISLFHCIFSTKDRTKLITADMESRLYPYIGGIARENKMSALAVGGTEDHVHVLLSLPGTISISKAVQLIKGGSSKWIHDTFPAHHHFQWQEGFGAFSIATSGMEDTIAYIASQKEHHKKRTFKEEFILFLKKNGVQYDERYVWG